MHNYDKKHKMAAFAKLIEKLIDAEGALVEASFFCDDRDSDSNIIKENEARIERNCVLLAVKGILPDLSIDGLSTTNDIYNENVILEKEIKELGG